MYDMINYTLIAIIHRHYTLLYNISYGNRYVSASLIVLIVPYRYNNEL